MVGVSGRSKGCHACRKRKIACSLEKPECLLCLNSSRKCPGYERERIFIVHNSSTLFNSNRPKQRPHQTKETDISAPVHDGAKHNWNRPSLQGETGTSLMPLSPALASSRNLNVTANRQLFLAGLLARFQTSSPHNPVSSGHWLAMLPQLMLKSPALESFALAFCTARLGHRLKDSQLVRHSLELYTHGLSELQKALWDPLTMYDDQTLGACLLCAIYEVYECPGRNPKAYQSHHDGCARLIQERGPAAHRNGVGHSMFVAFRLIGALQALASRSTFLAEQDWNTIPFSEVPKAPINQLVDILLEAPRILSEADQLKDIANPFFLLQAATRLLESCRKLDRQQRTFYANFTASVPTGRLYWPMPRPMPLDQSPSCYIDPALASTLPTAQLTFPDIRIAQVLMLHWAMAVMLHSGMFRLQQLVQDLHSDGVSLSSEHLIYEQPLLTLLTPEQVVLNPSEPLNNISDAHQTQQHFSLSTDKYQSIRMSEWYESSSDLSSTCSESKPLPTSYLHQKGGLHQSLITISHFCGYADNILCSVLFCLLEPSRDLGLTVMVAPLKLAYDVLRDWPEIEECQKYVQIIGQVLKYIGDGGSQGLGVGGGVEIVKYF